ncbi:MAG: 8-oxo-dGTP pyrophosphatase MutT (NUDIX family) [Paracrocinitomix sp.]|jgi:8-oxo-dGTP pyrophosphatase MutT (NUDIX family)|tara:strand:+ start:240 stop:674 length:435 start_codon:yes stop_codon:yes gene_type:complete
MECIEAAGGVVVDMSKNKPRYLLIHRPRYNDWSLPKGKLNEGETHHDAALREVKEETGLVCDVLAKLSPVNYTTPNGNAKQVKYWLMQTRSGDFVKNDEVDDVSWLKRSKAISMLTHVHDQAVLVEAHVLVKELRRQAKNEAAE